MTDRNREVDTAFAAWMGWAVASAFAVRVVARQDGFMFGLGVAMCLAFIGFTIALGLYWWLLRRKS